MEASKSAYHQGCDAAEQDKPRESNPYEYRTLANDRTAWFSGFDDWTSEFTTYKEGRTHAKNGGKRTEGPTSETEASKWLKGFDSYVPPKSSAKVDPANIAAWQEGQSCAEGYGQRSANPYLLNGQACIVDTPADHWFKGYDATMKRIRAPSPGPFSLEEEGEHGVQGCREVYDATGQPIASTHGLADDYQDWANARLFAAAPGLLTAFRDAQRILAEHLPPNGPSKGDTLGKLYEIFDGPQASAIAALIDG